LVDGGVGDDDGIANGIIIDPSGLGKAAQCAPAASPVPDAGGGGGGGGGCFISSAGDVGSLGLLGWWSLLGLLGGGLIALGLFRALWRWNVRADRALNESMEWILF
jgi:hypothetical protein